MPQFTLSNFNRFILDTEDDANSPLAEELMTQLRENLMGLFMLMCDTNISGTATGISGAVLTDTGDCGSIVNGWTLLITSGTGKGNIYTIDAHDANTITCTGDDLEADGVAAGDTWKAFYDLKVNADGHDHDGVNSKSATVGAGAIDTAQLADGAVETAKMEYNAGSTRLVDKGAGNWQYEVMDTAGAWTVTCPIFAA